MLQKDKYAQYEEPACSCHLAAEPIPLSNPQEHPAAIPDRFLSQVYKACSKS